MDKPDLILLLQYANFPFCNLYNPTIHHCAHAVQWLWYRQINIYIFFFIHPHFFFIHLYILQLLFLLFFFLFDLFSFYFSYWKFFFLLFFTTFFHSLSFSLQSFFFLFHFFIVIRFVWMKSRLHFQLLTMWFSYWIEFQWIKKNKKI